MYWYQWGRGQVGWIGRLGLTYTHFILLLFSHSVMSDSATPWTVARQAPLSTRFQEYWSGLPFSTPGESPWPKDQIHISYIGRLIPYCWVTREAHIQITNEKILCIAQGTLLNSLWWPKWKGNSKRGVMCTCIADSLCYTEETNTTL